MDAAAAQPGTGTRVATPPTSAAASGRQQQGAQGGRHNDMS